MGNKQSYLRRQQELLADSSICQENRKLYKDFLERKEYQLQRKNGLRELDESCYKTLYEYILKLYNINTWFANKPLTKITKADIKRVFDALEDGKIKTKRGKPFEDRVSYYNKLFKSDLFEMIGKADIAREVLDVGSNRKERAVRFITEDDFKKLVAVTSKTDYKALLWLAFDIGENITALLQLKRKDFTRLIDENTKAPEYRVNLRKEYLKRARLARSELTNYKETVDFLDIILQDFKDEDVVFNFGYSAAVKFMDRAVRITKLKCSPNGERVTWKDLRSSMACDLLTKEWTTDEINRRLGHRPSSSEIDRYVNFLAIDGKKPQRKVYQHNLAKIQAELEEAKNKERLYQLRLENLQKQVEQQHLEKDREIEQLRQDMARRFAELMKHPRSEIEKAIEIKKARK